MNKTPISILQELMVQRKQAMPDYYSDACTDVPGATFKCTVNVGKIMACGYATTKKEAKQNSASKALELLGFSRRVPEELHDPVISSTIGIQQNTSSIINYVGKLNEFASANQKMYPSYDNEMDLIPMTINGSFVTKCNFCNIITEGYGSTKKQSKQDAAQKMLERLKTEVISVTAQMETLKIDRLKNIEKLSEKMISTYEILSSSEQNVVVECSQFIAVPNLKEKVLTLEELKHELEKYNHKYKIEMFQRDPSYIMMMKFDGTNAVLMGNGESKEEALKDLFDSAIQMLSHGFSLESTLH